MLAPWDPPDSISRRLHRSHPELREAPDYLIPLGRTVGFGANGAVSNISAFPEGPISLRRELKAGNYDVVHVHEPLAPLVGWDAMVFRGAPVVGTFHAYSTKGFPNHVASLLGARRRMNQLSARIAVSEAAAWTGRRWFGGEYAIVPNGVDIEAAPQGPKSASDELRLLFVGRAEERKGLPVLLAAFQALVEHVPSRLTIVGSDPEEISRRVGDPDLMNHIDVLGKVSDSILWRQLGEADLLCAPSLAGESFGMVLIEAMAAGTGVVASAIAGYSDVVTNGVDGILVPPADPQALAEELQLLAHEPVRIKAMGEAGRRSAERYAWPRISEEVAEVYEKAIDPAPAAIWPPEAYARRTGMVRLDGGPKRPAKRLPSLEPTPPDTRGRGKRARQEGRRGGRQHPRPRPDRPRRPAHRRRPGGEQHHRLRRQVGGDRLRSDGGRDVRARGVLGRNLPRGAARVPRAPPRRDLGDDDRRPHVGDLAGATRRARQGDGALPSRRPHA